MSTGTTPRIIDNRYILDEDWREGGMARVYRAFDRKDHRTVAVKILARELNPDERLVNRVFDREQRSLERLRHENIVELLDGGRDTLTGEPYFVFEWVDRNLTEWLEAVPCAGWDDFANRFGFPILEGLTHAHERQVQHRDIKPGNILVTEEGVPKISDFGIAKIRPTSSLEQRSPTTPRRPYVPPRGETSPSRDVYAYAVLVLTTLAGVDPLSEEYEKDRYGQWPMQWNGRLYLNRYGDLLASCVSDDPDDRPKSAGALLGRLRVLHGESRRRDCSRLRPTTSLLPRAGREGCWRRWHSPRNFKSRQRSRKTLPVDAESHRTSRMASCRKGSSTSSGRCFASSR